MTHNYGGAQFSNSVLVGFKCTFEKGISVQGTYPSECMWLASQLGLFLQLYYNYNNNRNARSVMRAIGQISYTFWP